jgi:hypothetical protein
MMPHRLNKDMIAQIKLQITQINSAPVTRVILFLKSV